MEYADEEDPTEPPKAFTDPTMPPKGPYTRVPIVWGNREFYMDDPKDATDLTQHLINTIGTQQSDLKQMVDQLATIPVEQREGTSTNTTSANVTVHTGGEGTWKPVITCWVHLELMCIFPTM